MSSGGSVEDRLASLLSIAADAIILLDRQQRILLFNEGAERIFGWTSEEVVGRSIDLLLPERFRDVHREHVEGFASAAVSSRRMGERTEIFGLRKGGEEFPAEASIAKVGDGPNTAFTVVLRDITDRKRARERLRQKDRQLEEAQALARLGSWEWDLEADRVTWSDEMYRVYGLEPGSVEVTLAELLSRVHSDDRERVREVVERAREEGEPFSFVHRIVHPDGAVRVVHGRGRTIRDASGKAVRMVGTGQDVTERVRSERRARRLATERAARAQAETNFRRMEFLAEAGRILSSSLDPRSTLESIADIPVPYLAEYSVVYLEDENDEDEAGLRLAASSHSRPEYAEVIARIERQYRPDPRNVHSVVGEAFRTGEARLVRELSTEFFERVLAEHPEALPSVREVAPRSLIVVPLEIRERRLGVLALYRSADEPPYEEVDLAVARRLAGKAALALDNARLYQSEREARSQAEEAAALRDEVLAIVSHDLRSPLNTISICGELLGREDTPEETRREHWKLLHSSVKRMAQLIQDLLDVGRIETGRLMIRPEPAEPAELLEEAVQAARPPAEAKGIELVRRAEDGVPPAEVDRRRLQQVFSNLMENAIRHTPPGGRIELSARAGENGDVSFTVSDTGEGIPETRQRKLFDRVWQGREGGRARSGLGLTIVRGVVEAHGGRVWVESEPGAGAMFRFTIPTAARTESGPAD